MNRLFYTLVVFFTGVFMPRDVLAESMSSQNYSIESGRIDAGSVSAIVSESEHYRTEYADESVSSVNESDESPDDDNDGGDDSDDRDGSSERISGTNEDSAETTGVTTLLIPDSAGNGESERFSEPSETSVRSESLNYKNGNAVDVRVLLLVFPSILFGFIFRALIRYIRNKRHQTVVLRSE